METIARSDIFFFITTIAVGLLTIVSLVALVYLIKILRNIKDVSDLVKKESYRVVGDIDSVRQNLKSLTSMIPLGVRRIFRRSKSENKSAEKKKE